MIDPQRSTSISAGGSIPNIFYKGTFARSNGSVSSRVYERLTKASRRRVMPWVHGDFDRMSPGSERAYRRGVFDTLNALRAELQ